MIRPSRVVSQSVEKDKKPTIIITMVQIQILQKSQVVDLEDVQDVPQVLDPASYTTLHIREWVDNRKASSLRSLVMVGTALMVLVLVSWAVWMRQFWNKDGLEEASLV